MRLSQSKHSGKTQARDGSLVAGLYELIYEVDSNGDSSERWQPSLTTAQTGDMEISLARESTSVRVTFKWEATSPGQPNLYIVTDVDGDGTIGEEDFNHGTTSQLEESV